MSPSRRQRSKGGPCEHVRDASRVVIKKDHSVADAYLQNLIEEMDLADVAHHRLVTQMHWGGGTPTYLQPSQITELFNAITDRFEPVSTAECSIEIDPRVTTSDHLPTLRSLGFKRGCARQPNLK
jgi:oxygen-independent coproporphyrinogen III oxidase